MRVNFTPEALDELERARSELGSPGAAIALSIDGSASLQAGLGSLAGHPHAPFYAYSVTKTILATLTVQLAAEGVLGLDEPLRTWLPELPIHSPVTLRQALNHTGGLPDYGGLAAYHEAVRRQPETAWTTQRFLELVTESALWFPPGQGWAYSNLGYLLVKQILTAATGATPEALLAERIAVPLGLTATHFVTRRAEAAGLTPGYQSSPTGRDNIIERYDPGWVAHGVVRTTAADLTRLMGGLTGGRLVPEAWYHQMTAVVPVPGEVPAALEPGYGLGLMAQTLPLGRVVGHNGGGPGYSVACWSLGGTDRRLVGACMVDRDLPNAAQALLFRLFETVVAAG